MTQINKLFPHIPIDRATGRSTALALRALADAIEHPGTPVALRDHHPGTLSHLRLLHECRSMVERLGLKFIDFHRGRLTVTSNHIGPAEPQSP